MHLNYLQLKKISVLCLVQLIVCSSSLSLIAVGKPSEGLPGRRVGGGSRGCQEKQSSTTIDPKQLIALVPQDNLGKTATDYPTLFFRLPKLSTPKNIEFVLRDDRDEKVYKTKSLSQGKSGILSMPLPASAMKPLAVGKTYHWYFTIICDPSDRAKDITIEGNIQRVQPPTALVSKLQQTSPSKQVDLLLANGLWHDALATAIMLRQSRPQNPAIQSKWAELLKGVGLSEIAQDEILTPSLSAQPVSIKP